MIKKAYLILLILFFINISFGQNRKVTVSIIDSNTKKELPYASVYFSDSRAGTISDINGNATVSLTEVKKLDTLICSYIGYKTKKIPTESILNNHLVITLKEEIVYLDELVVNGERKIYMPLQIVKKAIRNTKDNYFDISTYLLGFYRETVFEDDKCIQLNEAKIRLHYSAYPQKRFVRKTWRNYWDREYELGGGPCVLGGTLFGEAQWFMYFNSIKDQSEILEYRISDNFSEYGIEPLPKGAVLSLTATDKIKYREDFFNHYNFNKYIYNLKGVAYHNGFLCYIIHFYPKNIQDNYVRQNLSKKMKSAIWIGNIYISIDDFAVVGMEYEFSKLANFMIYKDYITNVNHINVEYIKKDSIWHLHYIKSNQTNTYVVQDTARNYICNRELWVDSISANHVGFINSDNVLQHKVYSSLRSYNSNLDFDENYWNTCENMHKLPFAIKNELTKSKSLNDQFIGMMSFNDSLQEPIAMKLSAFKYYYNDTIYDDFEWLVQRDNTNTIDYIIEENNYTNNFFIPLKTQIRNLYNKTRKVIIIDTTRSSLKKKKSKFKWVYNDMYPKFVVMEEDGEERVIVNVLDYKIKYSNFILNDLFLSPDSNKVSYSYSIDGDFAKLLQIKSTKDTIEYDSIIDMYEHLWINDSIIVYSKLNKSKRCDRIFLHNINNAIVDSLILQEDDNNFEFSLKYSKSGNVILLYSESKNENEIYYFDLASSDPVVLKKYNTRKKGVVSQVFCDKESNYLLSNLDINNNQIYSIKLHDNSKNTVISNYENEGAYLYKLQFTKSYFIITEIYQANYRIRIIAKSNLESYYLGFPSEIYDIEDIKIDNYDLDNVLVYYSTISTPYTVYNVNLKDKDKEYEIEYQSSISDLYRNKKYTVEKVFVKSRDHKKIPMIIAYDKCANKKHKGLVLKVYGAYGSHPSNGFYADNIALMDMGYTIATPYVRGSMALGKEWYDSGKLSEKLNSFNDYIDCAEYLIENNYTTSEYLVGYGASAGGLVLGYVANKRPSLFKTLVFDHPFLDVLNTMMYDTLAMTSIEYTEWGNPSTNTQDYKYIKDYSPYQNIKRQEYPNMYFKAGFNDVQTPYWQIVKYVAKIRENSINKPTILLSTDMYSGHMGNTTANSWIISFSEQFSFVNSSLGLNIENTSE